MRLEVRAVLETWQHLPGQQQLPGRRWWRSAPCIAILDGMFKPLSVSSGLLPRQYSTGSVTLVLQPGTPSKPKRRVQTESLDGCEIFRICVWRCARPSARADQVQRSELAWPTLRCKSQRCSAAVAFRLVAQSVGFDPCGWQKLLLYNSPVSFWGLA